MAWKRQETKFDENPNGVATIVLLKGRKLGVVFGETSKFAGQKYRVSEWPDEINPKLLPGNEWMVNLTGKDNDEIFSIRPVDGYFEVKFVGFPHKDGEPPVPKYMADWKYPDTVFFALLEIVGGLDAAKGMTVSAMLPYRFDADEDGNVMYTKVSDRSNTVKTMEFMDLVGADKTPMKFSENILPDIQRRALKSKTMFGIFLKNGYVDYFSKAHSQEIEEVEDVGWEDEEDSEVLEFEENGETVSDTGDFDWD